MLKLKARWVPTLAAAAAIAATLSLAGWQLGRAHEKEALAARIGQLSHDAPITLSLAAVRAEDVQWRRVTARGRFEPRYGILVDNRIHNGVPGYHVVMPIALGAGGGYVLVNRGWTPADPDRSRLPRVRTPDGVVEVSGLAVTPTKRFFELSGRVAQGAVWQNLTLERYRQAFPIAVQPIVIQQDSPLDDGLTRDWSPPDFGVDRHYGYAFQWFALAVTVAVFYVVTHVRRRP